MSQDHIKLLIALDALLEHGNVTRAAAHLGVSQPAMSGQLARLRELFRDPLIITARGGNGVVLTAHASAIKEPLRMALAQLWHLFEPPLPFTPTESERTFTLILNDNAASMLAGSLIAAVQQAGGRKIKLSFLNPTGDICAVLEGGEADIAIGSLPEMREGLICRPLVRDEYKVACRPGLLSRPMDMDTYSSLPHVMVSTAGGKFRSAIDVTLERLGRTRQVAISVQSYALVPAVVSQSDCLCTLPSRFLTLHSTQLEIHDLPFEFPNFVLSATWHGRANTDPAHLWLREQIFSVAAVNLSAR